MEPIRRFLAATDFSAGGQQAARRAARLAATLGAGLAVLHVVEPATLAPLRGLLDPGRDFGRAIREQAEIQLAALVQELERQHGVVVQGALGSGEVLGAINAAAADADVLVLGARGESPVRDFLLGTTAERLVRLACRPALVVRSDPTAGYSRVLAATDFSPASEAALQVALRLAPGARLHLLHCYDVLFEGKLRLAGASDAEIQRCRDHELAGARQQAESLALRVNDGRPIDIILRRGDARVELLQVAAELGADLIAVGKKGRSQVGDALLGSLTSCALTQADCDVVMAPG